MDSLIIKVLNGEATTGEIRELSRWMQDEPNEAHFRQLKKAWHLTNGIVLTPEREEEELQRYLARIRASRGRRRLLPGRWARYAALLALPALGVATFLYLSRPGDQAPENAVARVIRPGTSKALLVLHDQQAIELTADRGVVIRDDSILTREGGGEVSFLPSPSPAPRGGEQKWNRLITPRGGEYRLTLADGTRLHLNSGTTVEFPVEFSGDRREVRLTGEAYFEVAGEADRPFTVTTGTTRVRVRGTTFNVNAYENARTRVLLVTGKVGVQGSDDEEYLLRPSQLIEFDAGGHFASLREVDARAGAAWREGFFTFENEDIESILTTLARWYDVEISYIDESVKAYHFTGSVERYENIDAILNAIGKMVRVRFSIQDNMIIVSK